MLLSLTILIRTLPNNNTAATTLNIVVISSSLNPVDLKHSVNSMNHCLSFIVFTSVTCRSLVYKYLYDLISLFKYNDDNNKSSPQFNNA